LDSHTTQAKWAANSEAKPDENDAKYALDFVKRICMQVGPGLPGTPQERERADIIKEELQSYLGQGDVIVEEFAFTPGSFLDSYRISAVFTLIASILSILLGIIDPIASLGIAITALVFALIAVIVFVIEFFFSLELIDPLFNKKKSINVIGKLRKPQTTEVKRLLILSGHHDSAWENNWLRLHRHGFFIATATWMAGLIAMPALAVIQLACIITGNGGLVYAGVLEWPLLAYPIVPSAILSLFFVTGRKNGGNVPGAADNLSACAAVVAMCRFLVRNSEHIPADTEIRFVTFGSEEAGLRGSRRYVESHLEELKRLDARVLNLETISYRTINILSSELNGTQKNSPEIIKSAASAADRAGVPYRVRPAILGEAGDAGPFSRAGIKAVTLLGLKMPEQMLAFYHQKQDRPEVLGIEPLLNVLRVSFEWVRRGGE